MRRLISLCFFFLFPLLACANEKVLNIYAWTGEIPAATVQQFEQETGIKVNLSTYENNEIMYAKIRATKNAGYDLVMPSSYFVDRMQRQGLLAPLDKSQLSQWKNLNPQFLHLPYDPQAAYSLPFIWGLTGIFYNATYFPADKITTWQDLWQPQFNNQLMVLDDMREMFSVTLLDLGYSANDTNPQHIQQAFFKLRALMQNIKVFSTDTVVSNMIDEDATVGIAWNGDVYKAAQENPHIRFVFPQQGFVVWIDNFAIPKNAPHKTAAYTFLNFILRPDVARDIALATHFPTTNLAGQRLLPADIRNNPIIYPSAQILKRGQFQTDVGDDTLALYEKYWEELKMSS